MIYSGGAYTLTTLPKAPGPSFGPVPFLRMNNLFFRHLSPVILTSLCALLAATTAPISAQAAGGIGKDGVTATKVFNVNVPPVGHPLKRESYNPVLKRDDEGNPLFTADPAALVEGDTLYVYAGRDEAAIGGWYSMNEWVCYSTKDMVDWKYERVVMKVTDFAWAAGGTAWACQVVKRHGKYFLYSTTGRPGGHGYSVAVAVSDRPTGPFVDAIGGPLFDNAITTGGPEDSIEDIDPTVFVDDDGQAYLYWGNRTLHYALLNKDMISLKDLNGDGKITEGADIFSKIEIKDRPAGCGFGEAPWLYKAKGKYYLVDAMSMPQQVAYAMSDSPRGPWQYKGVILNENRRPDGSQGDFNSDTSHPAVIEFKGQWYVFYHSAAQPTGGQSRRSVCVEKMSYNADGTIARSFITSTGPLGGAVRIQSGRQADHYITFLGFDVKLDTLPADDRAFRWDVTQGLTDEATLGTVSMQSVTHPGYYLTVKGDAVALEKNDASVDFRRRATFKTIPVPSDKKLTAFQSLADPSRYLRCSAVTGKLTTEIITSATNSADKSDATFKLISDADAY